MSSTDKRIVSAMVEQMEAQELQIFPQVLVGFRYWVVTPTGYLAGVTHQTVWRPDRPMVSQCRFGHIGPAEHDVCGCGLYAYHTLDDAAKQQRKQQRRSARIVGVVVGRGQAQIHQTGWRAEEAQIMAIAAVDPQDHEIAQKLGERYQIPVVSTPEQLTPVAQQYGLVAPETLPLPTKQPQTPLTATEKMEQRYAHTKSIMGSGLVMGVGWLFGGLALAALIIATWSQPPRKEAIRLGLMNDPIHVFTNQWHVAKAKTWTANITRNKQMLDKSTIDYYHKNIRKALKATGESTRLTNMGIGLFWWGTICCWVLLAGGALYTLYVRRQYHQLRDDSLLQQLNAANQTE